MARTAPEHEDAAKPRTKDGRGAGVARPVELPADAVGRLRAMEREARDPLPTWVRIALVVGLLYGFLIAIQCMGASFKMLGQETSRALFAGIENPFASLSVGVLATVLVQSSSTTTSMIVALVGSGQITVAHAVPMILGANVGTTITNTLVSIGHVTRSLEFRRAFAAATVHDFFNLLCVAALLPLELATGFLSRSALSLTELLAGSSGRRIDSPVKATVEWGYDGLETALRALGLADGPLALAVLLLGIALTFVCLFGVTRNMRRLISGPLEQAINRSLGKSTLLGVLVGILVTFAVQSSSITTSLLVPMCAAGILRLGTAFPIMLGANIGTTLTALLASMAADSTAGLSIALVHLLFNVLGVGVFVAVPPLQRVPVRMARVLAARAAQNPLWIAAYVLGVFVALPLLGWWIFARLWT